MDKLALSGECIGHVDAFGLTLPWVTNQFVSENPDGVHWGDPFEKSMFSMDILLP